MTESEDELLLHEEAEQMRARSNLERTVRTTEDGEYSMRDESNTEQFSSKNADECTTDGAGSDATTL